MAASWVEENVVVTMPPPRCGECVHAAFDDAGVYCKEFHESILNERVAEDCGMFENGNDRLLPRLPPMVGLSNPPDSVPDPLVLAKRSTLALEKDWQDHGDAPVTAYEPVELLHVAGTYTPVDPPVEKLDMAGLVAKFDDYLSLMHCQLWGGSFNIWDQEGRHKAALWLAEVVTEALGGDDDVKRA